MLFHGARPLMRYCPQGLLKNKRETAGTADSPAVEILLNEVPLIGLVSGLPAQYGVELGRFGFLMTQEGLHRHQGRPLIQQRGGQGMSHGMRMHFLR